MDTDIYLRNVVQQHTPQVINGLDQQLAGLVPHIHAWANGYEYELKLSGSHAKGTGITGTTDVDIFISLHPSVSDYNTLENVYTTLRNRFNGVGYATREQNVALGINHGTLKIDLVPGVRHAALGNDHSIWKRKLETWTKTNIDKHINHVSNSGKAFDIRLVKIWRKLQDIEFPSFYLELSVIEALKGGVLLGSSPSKNFIKVMNYLRDSFVDRVITDPANTNNQVSDELTQAEKQKIREAAITALNGNWNQVVW